MAEDNQNNQENPTSSFKDQVLRSLRGEEGEDEQSSSSQQTAHTDSQQNNSESMAQSSNKEQAPETKETEPVSVGSRSGDRSETKETSRTEKATEFQEILLKPDEKKKQTRKREDRIVSKIVLIIASVLTLVIAVFGFTFYKYVSDGLQPLDSKDTKLVQVYIPADSSNKKISNILEDSKVIKSAMVFNYYAKFKNLSDFQAGYYQMSPNMTLDEVGALLRGGGTAEPTKIADAKVTIPEGYDIEKISEAVADNTSFKKEEFIELMKNDTFFNSMKQKYPELLASAAEAEGVRYRLEGYLFPATYDYYKDMTIEDFAEQMVAKTNSIMEPLTSLVHARNMTIQQVLTLASLVEKEGVKEEDRKKIAQVFYNRLAANMPLQSDISILYSLGEHKEVVTYKDLEVDSPYNLYKNTGYGPGPMDSPGEEAINAVLNPTENNYLYFIADISTGKVYFSETYEEHQELEEKYINNSGTKESN